EEWTVQIRPDCTANPAAFKAALAVVAEPGDDATERPRTGVELRAAGVVLEPRERAHGAGLELALEQHVADHARVAGDRLAREEADAGQVLAVEAWVRAPQQRVAAADREQRGTAVDRRAHTGGLRDEVIGDQRLLAVLAAADVEQVVLARVDGVAHGNRAHVE